MAESPEAGQLGELIQFSPESRLGIYSSSLSLIRVQRVNLQFVHDQSAQQISQSIESDMKNAASQAQAQGPRPTCTRWLQSAMEFLLRDLACCARLPACLPLQHRVLHSDLQQIFQCSRVGSLSHGELHTDRPGSVDQTRTVSV